MTGLLVLKERLKEFYGKYDIYIDPLFHFVFGLSAVLILNANIGFMAKLSGPLAALAAGLICSFLPYSVGSLLIALLMLVHLFSASMEIALIVGVLVFIIILLYCGLQPGNSFLLVLTPMMFFLNVPYVVPLLVRTDGKPDGGNSRIVRCLYVLYSAVYQTECGSTDGNGGSCRNITQKYGQIMKSMLSNQTALVMIGAFALSIVVGLSD